jgi:hypothetical protein
MKNILLIILTIMTSHSFSQRDIGTITPSERLEVNVNILTSGIITPSDERYKKR